MSSSKEVEMAAAGASEVVVPKNQAENQMVGDLLFAASRGDLYGLTKLIKEQKMSPNAGDYDKRTALHLAAGDGHPEVVKTLIQFNASVNVTDRWNETPLDGATKGKHAECVKLLLAAGARTGDSKMSENNFLLAVDEGDKDKVQMLLDSGVSVNSADYDARSALHLAVSKNDMEMTELLLKKGANINATDRFGGTPMTDALRNASRVGEDAMRELLLQYGGGAKTDSETDETKFFLPVFAVMELAFFIAYCFSVRYGEGADGKASGQGAVDHLYAPFQDVHVMIFIGFGFLMTFLRKYGYGSVSLNMLVAAFCIQWYILWGGFMHQAFHNHYDKIYVTLETLILSDFAAASVLITFGALLGKVSPTQLLLVGFLEIIFFAINENIGIEMGISDVGGSMVVHTFGAYFGLGASWFMTAKHARNHPNNSANYHSDIFSMIGTVFLWMFWPSFNSALAGPLGQQRTIINTVIALTGSCMTAFLCSYKLRGERKFDMVDIQNATLAGGVMVGTSANMVIYPAGAMGIGCLAGILSVVGYVKIQGFLEKKIGLYDTCGVNNLHGMPGFAAGIVGCVFAALAGDDTGYYGKENLMEIFPGRFNDAGELVRTASEQAGQQIAFLFITFGVSLLTGAITGAICNKIDAMSQKAFSDDKHFVTPQMETPYYFDLRGEIKTHGNGSHVTGFGDVETGAPAPIYNQQSGNGVAAAPAAPPSVGDTTWNEVMSMKLDQIMVTLNKQGQKSE